MSTVIVSLVRFACEEKKIYNAPLIEIIKPTAPRLLDMAFSNPSEDDGWEGDAKHNFDDGDIEEIQYNIWGEN